MSLDSIPDRMTSILLAGATCQRNAPVRSKSLTRMSLRWKRRAETPSTAA